ncbi:fimbrial biogenesis chaperone [Serratia fonticola]|uniref:fimbrial biogenesis chaperone n=1 Tax=Serratia fonticola TaxID=47917 RepID=UPI000423669B|nr:molecular chaperone [Serratia fonticola]
MPFACSFFSALMLMTFSVFPAIAEANGGVSLNQTRVVFLAGDKAQTLKVKNSGTQNYLIQSRVQRAIDHVGETSFIITPPLFKLGPESSQLLRILKQDKALPADRESLFYLTVSAIPGQPEPVPDAARLSMGFQFAIKLFYRPENLQVVPENTHCQLKFTSTKEGVRVDNPTPYFLSLGGLQFDGRAVDLDKQPSMIAPMDSAKYSLAQPIRLAQWQTINDFGGLSASCQQAVLS